jgi:hypothetical protein
MQFYSYRPGGVQSGRPGGGRAACPKSEQWALRAVARYLIIRIAVIRTAVTILRVESAWLSFVSSTKVSIAKAEVFTGLYHQVGDRPGDLQPSGREHTPAAGVEGLYAFSESLRLLL